VLDAEAKRRLHANPLRILDTKNPAMQDLVNAAPQLLGYLGEESLAHFEGLKKILDANNVQYTVNPRLVRGLDYYNRTVFEWVTDKLGAQGTVCAGGRYDPLIETFGGKPTPGVGFAMGIERLIELMKAQGEPAEPSQCDVYMVHQGDEARMKAFNLAERIRDAGLDVVLHCATLQGAGSFKSQMKKADGSGASFAVIIGEDEVANDTVAVKSLREAEGPSRKAWPSCGGGLPRRPGRRRPRPRPRPRARALPSVIPST
jgi:histidyl-tRNA synthetase